VILINLLPHREAKRRQRKQAFFVGLGLSVALGALVVGLWYALLNQRIAAQESRNDFLQAEIGKLELQITDIANLKQEIEALKARQRSVEDLQSDRNMPVYLLDELVKQTPPGVYLTAIKQSGQQVTVSGVAQTNERVSEMLRNVSYHATWLASPELVEIKAAMVSISPREQRRLFEFQIRLALKRAPSAEPAASAASAAASAPQPDTKP
jgi:type IV pilus assembly protein PilN